MSGHERQQWERLDAGIDALLAGAPLDPAEDADGLLAAARLMRALPSEPVWPAADFPTQLATRLVTALRPNVARPPSLLLPNGAAMRSSAAAPGAPPEPATAPRWWRQAAQLSAALAAFGLVALVLVLVFRSGGGNDAGPPQFGASPAAVCQPSTPLISATTGELTYFVGDQDNQKIYRAAPDGSDAVVMQTHAGVDDFTLSWSPDGSQFAYVNSETDASGKVTAQAVMVASADSQSARRLTGATQAIESEPAWSPTGGAIAYASAGGHSVAAIYSVAPDGAGAVRLSPNDGADYSHPLWSPDGRQIAFLRDGALMVVNADGTDPHRLRAERVVAAGFAWAPDSCRLAFSSEVNGSADIYVIDAAGGDARLITSGDAEDWSPAWVSNDELMFARSKFSAADPEAAADIYLIHADGAGTHKLDGLPRVKQKTPVVAPDGTQLAFAGFNYDTQHWEQYVVDLNSGNVQRMFVGIMPGALTPAWRPVAAPIEASPTRATPTPSSAALPTPDASGIVRATSFIEAQALVTFPLVMPEPLPDGVTFDGATVEFAPPGTTGTPGTTSWGAARDVTFNFNVASADPNLRPTGIQFLQSTLRNEVAADEHTTVTQVTLGGKRVTKSLLKRDEGGDVLSYNWSTATVSYTVVSVLRDGVTEELVAQLVAATPLPDGASIVPPDVQPTPTASPASPAPPSASGEPYRQVAAWDAQLQTAGGMVVGPDGSVYLIDSTHGHIRVFASDGSLTLEWDLPPDEFNGGPNDIALGPDGDIYALDGGDALVLKYDQRGNLVTSWGGYASKEDHMQLGKFVSPFDIAVSDDGLVYVSELTFNGIPRVQRFTTDGQFVDEWIKAADMLPSAGGQHIEIVGNRDYVGHWVAGGLIPLITVFDADHNVIATPLAGETSDLDALALRVTSFAVDDAGNVYLADARHTQVVKLAPDGSVAATWLVEGEVRDAGEGFLVAVDDSGRVYTVDSLSRQVKVFAHDDAPGSAATSIETSSPTLTLDPAFGICASTATARGSGFAPGATVRITSAQVGADAVSTAADGIAVAQDGTFGVLLHAPEQLGCAEQPDALPGQVLNVRAMTVTGETQSATAAFLVAPHLPSEIEQAAGLPSCGAAQLVEGVIPQPNPDYDCLVAAYQTGGSAQFVVRWDDAGVVLVSFFLLQPGQPIDLWVGRYNETMDDFAWSREACVGLDLEHGLIGIANCVITSPDPTPTP